MRYSLILLISFISVNIFASETKLQSRELQIKEMKAQNKEIVKLASTELSKSLPQKIDKVTQLISVNAKNTTLEYIFLIDTRDKTDNDVKNEDHSKMKKNITYGACRTSKRFLEADISLSYVYKSMKTKNELFRFDVDKESCTKL